MADNPVDVVSVSEHRGGGFDKSDALEGDGRRVTSVCVPEGVDTVVQSLAAVDLVESSGDASPEEGGRANANADRHKVTSGREAAANESSALIKASQNFPGYCTSEKMTPDDFEILAVVGQGAFGKVFQVRKKDSGEIFAMKVMRKEKILSKNQSEYCRQERDILTCISHPFIVKLHYSFQTGAKLYIILDFINGGHLFFQLYRQGFFSESLAKVYCAEIVLAVAHLHSFGIAHRDLKPENVLLDHTGHLVLTDFGLAKIVDGDANTNSMVGTMEYMAPEIILGKGHGMAADWWSVGVLVYEMLTGKHPFSSRNRQTLQKKILNERLKFPTYLTSEAIQLIKGLLNRDYKIRLGYGEGGAEKVKKLAFFKTINWKRLEAKIMPPPFLPDVASEECVANFDEEFTKLPPEDISPCTTPREGEGGASSKALGRFNGFTFIAPRMEERMLGEQSAATVST